MQGGLVNWRATPRRGSGPASSLLTYALGFIGLPRPLHLSLFVSFFPGCPEPSTRPSARLVTRLAEMAVPGDDVEIGGSGVDWLAMALPVVQWRDARSGNEGPPDGGLLRLAER